MTRPINADFLGGMGDNHRNGDFPPPPYPPQNHHVSICAILGHDRHDTLMLRVMLNVKNQVMAVSIVKICTPKK